MRGLSYPERIDAAARAKRALPSARVALAAGLAVVVLSGCGVGGLPTCGDSDATDLVGQIVNDLLDEAGVPDERFVRLRDVEELGYNAKDELRSCYATLVTTDGEAEVQYSIRWTDKAKGEFWVEASVR